MRFFHSLCLMVTLPIFSFSMEQTRTPEEQAVLAALGRLSMTGSESPASRPTASQPMDIVRSPTRQNRSLTSSPNPHEQHPCSSASYSPHSSDCSRGSSPDSANSARERSPERKASRSVPPTYRREIGRFDFPSASHGSWY